MKILRDNLYCALSMALAAQQAKDAKVAADFESGFQRMLKETIEAMKRGEWITVE